MNDKTFLRRNLDLWEDRRLFGNRYTELSVKYNITPVRCRQIFMKVEKRFCKYLTNIEYGDPKGIVKLKLHPIERTYFERAEAILRYSDNDIKEINDNETKDS